MASASTETPSNSVAKPPSLDAGGMAPKGVTAASLMMDKSEIPR